MASVDQRHGFPHVLQSPWKPLRDLVRGNVVTALKNARFCRDASGLVRVPWIGRQTTGALDLVSVHEWKFGKPLLEIRLQLAVVERGLPGAVDADNQMKDRSI